MAKNKYNLCENGVANELIPSTKFSIGWLADILHEKDNKFKEIVKKGNKKISKFTAVDLHDNHGFVSKVFQTKFFDDSSKDHFYSCIIKVPTLEGYEKLMSKMYEEYSSNKDKEKETTKVYLTKLLKVHNNECNFYEHFGNVPEFPIPRVFYIEKFDQEKDQTGVIVMEDLGGVGKMQGFVHSQRIEQVKHATKALAKFHAYQLEKDASNRTWTGLIGKSQTDKNMHNESRKAFLGAKTYNNGIFEKQISEIENVIFNYDAIKYMVDDICEELGLPKLVTHGDFHAMNILYKLDEEEALTNQIATIVDFQATFEGNPALDLARLLVTSTDAEIRREIETFICDFYMSELTKNMSAYSQKPDFDVEKFKTAYDFAFIYQTPAVLMLPAYFVALGQKEVNKNRKEIVEAEVAKLELRGRLALEDCAKIIKKHSSHWSLKV